MTARNLFAAVFVALAAMATPAKAANENAKRDLNGNPVGMGITTTTAQDIRMLRTSPEGYLLTVSTGNQSPLPSGAATEATQVTVSTTLSAIKTRADLLATEATAATIAGDTTSLDAKVPSQGQAAMAASLPVAIASNQSAVPASQSGSWTTTTAADSITSVPISTGACAGTATLVLAADATAKTSMFCNEGSESVRIGDSNITASVGLLVTGETCVSLDGPGAAFHAALYCIRTGASSQNYSTARGF